jgi:hypothetical protein
LSEFVNISLSPAADTYEAMQSCAPFAMVSGGSDLALAHPIANDLRLLFGAVDGPGRNQAPGRSTRVLDHAWWVNWSRRGPDMHCQVIGNDQAGFGCAGRPARSNVTMPTSTSTAFS